uniref:Glycosyltransferase n=1 Tax=Dictyoglomus thermophilum TaxID=14 RepID=A0A7C3MGL1_DICTH
MNKNFLFFIDELYFYNDLLNSYISKYSAGNFIKLLQEELNINSSFLVPVRYENLPISYSTKVNLDEYEVEELPGWDSIISYYRNIIKPINFYYIKRKLKKLIDNYDVFWVRLPSPFGLWLGKEAEKNNKFVIYHVAGDIRMAYLSSKYKGIKKIIAQLMGNYLHRKSIQLGKNGVFLCTGSILYNIYKKANKKVFYFIDSTILSKDLKEPKRSLIEPIKFLYVGRILEEKGIFFLIDAMKELKEKYKLELHIVGFGKDENKLKQIIKDEDFIIFHGFIPQGEKLYEIYSSSDVFVMPTINYPEGFPRVILEAWANGLFVISSRVGGIEGLGQDFGNLLFFRPGDKSEFIKKVELILDNSEIRERLRNGILQIQRKITSEYMINFLKEILIEEGII